MHRVPEGADLEIWAAVTTPFGPDGELRLDAVGDQAAHLLAAGVNGAFVGGTTGEFPALSTAERLELAAAWAERRPAALGLGVHVGHTVLSEARTLARQAAGLGADMIAAVAPYYGSAARVEAVVDHLARIAEEAPGVPFCYYHIPGMTGLDLPASAVVTEAVKRIPTFSAVKFTDDDLLEFARTREAAPGVRVYFGKDELLPAAQAMGARAVIGSLYNFLAPLARRVFQAAAEGRLEEAARLHRPFREVAETAGRHGGLAVVKELAGRFGPYAGRCRSPWDTLGTEGLAAVDRLIRDLGPIVAGREEETR
ncbi:N-acetylneuraminate lyase [Thermocatellispora tengchongensis]|uniref:N-acetylneuraminate lyase n=1 Tax=Thermocatellispora tengchongensis TaxID=1073253 RepID=A0A840P6U3_9ACTN|nr:dihydrodipicolinate synthase family protein [Thermocatellispora tengchongensis]MBB5131735.1 N-acetylneuraminate lyase [Thermocatellispora tengchongensis]